MMVIMGTSSLPAAGGTPVSRVNIHPADRCTWTQGTDVNGDGYTIGNAFFYPGAGGAGSDIAITSPVLGVIGKSGRFVAITN